MSVVVCRLIPPRPTFAQDATPEERALMAEHGAYWKALQAQGKVVVFGPVADPKGVWGLAVLEVADVAEAQHLTDHDPVILARRNFAYEVLPMVTANLRS